MIVGKVLMFYEPPAGAWILAVRYIANKLRITYCDSQIIVVFSLGIISLRERAHRHHLVGRYQFTHMYAQTSRKSCSTQKFHIFFTAHARIPACVPTLLPGMRM